jgi:hypothetical protein
MAKVRPDNNMTKNGLFSQHWEKIFNNLKGKDIWGLAGNCLQGNRNKVRKKWGLKVFFKME